jgi:V/A-type H+-transporting ATPase subunit E
MTEQLQALIERIHQEGVGKAEAEAEQILTKARAKAETVVREAEEKAAALRKDAEQEAASAEARGAVALEQSARDLLIRIKQSLENLLSRVVGRSVDEALSPAVVSQMLVKLAERYAGDGRTIEALVSPDDQEEIIEYFTNRYQDHLGSGVEIKVDEELQKGFRVSLMQKHVYHDFSSEAIAEALTDFLQPQLAETVRKAAEELSRTEEQGGTA